MFPDSPDSPSLARAPLGQRVSYPETYDPTLLFPIARADARRALGLGKGKLRKKERLNQQQRQELEKTQG